MIQRGSETLSYDVFNKPTRIQSTSTTTSFDYDANHERFRETNGTSTTYTLAGGLYEETVNGSTVTQKSSVDGVILNTKTIVSGVATSETLYVHNDLQGSGEAITNNLGVFVNRMSFSDWGKRQQADWKDGTPTLNFPTDEGYTGHHQLDKHSLVHMGGRVYDPNLGRFLSADLFVQSPYDSQSYNRYSYVGNNPLSRIDPTGYSQTTDFLEQADQHAMYWSWSSGVQAFQSMLRNIENNRAKENQPPPPPDGRIDDPNTRHGSYAIDEDGNRIDLIDEDKGAKNGNGMVLLSPVGNAPITSLFGVNRDCNPCSKLHLGTDYSVKTGTTVVTTADGEVVFAGTNPAYGHNVVIKVGMVNGKGLYIILAHGSSVMVKQGDKVTSGSEVLKSGNSGKSTNPHLHYEIRTSTSGPVSDGYFRKPADGNHYAPSDLPNLIN